jgi:hypothetical protein
LVAFRILSRRDEVRGEDSVTTDRDDERVEIRGGGDDAQRGGDSARRPQEQREDADQLRQRFFATTQWMFFSLPDMSPTRQSIAALASP